jgi:hypothetical protein
MMMRLLQHRYRYHVKFLRSLDGSGHIDEGGKNGKNGSTASGKLDHCRSFFWDFPLTLATTLPQTMVMTLLVMSHSDNAAGDIGLPFGMTNRSLHIRLSFVFSPIPWH